MKTVNGDKDRDELDSGVRSGSSLEAKKLKLGRFEEL
jgi:hypothetical protein